MKSNRRSLLVSGGAALGGAVLAMPASGQTAPAGIDGSKSAALFLKDDGSVTTYGAPSCCPTSWSVMMFG
jgi:hypothetical protein